VFILALSLLLYLFYCTLYYCIFMIIILCLIWQYVSTPHKTKNWHIFYIDHGNKVYSIFISMCHNGIWQTCVLTDIQVIYLTGRCPTWQAGVLHDRQVSYLTGMCPSWQTGVLPDRQVSYLTDWTDWCPTQNIVPTNMSPTSESTCQLAVLCDLITGHVSYFNWQTCFPSDRQAFWLMCRCRK